MQHKLNTQQTKTARGHAVLSWFVNPQDPDNAFATINAAYAAADALLPAGEPIVIKLKPGVDHPLTAGSLTLTAGRDLHIDGQSEAVRYTQTAGSRTTVTGNFIMPADVSVGARLTCHLVNLDLVGNVTEGSNWRFIYEHGCYRPTSAFSRTHGANGAQTFFNDISTLYNSGDFRLIDVDAGSATSEKTIFSVMNSYINSIVDGTPAISVLANTWVVFKNVHWEIVSGFGGGQGINLNTAANRVVMDNVAIFNSAFAGAITIFQNNTASTLYSDNVSITFSGGATLVFTVATGAWASVNGKMSATCSNSLSGPFTGLVWHDTRTNEILTWNGTYWVVGDLVRVETVLNVGGAAADHDLGWNVPTGFAVVKSSVRLLKALTGAGGAVKAGFGTKAAGDPDKYALTAAITAGNPNQTLNPTYNNGAGDDLAITGCDAAGAAAGTLAGSGAADVRTMVWMRPPVTLAS